MTLSLQFRGGVKSWDCGSNPVTQTLLGARRYRFTPRGAHEIDPPPNSFRKRVVRNQPPPRTCELVSCHAATFARGFDVSWQTGRVRGDGLTSSLRHFANLPLIKSPSMKPLVDGAQDCMDWLTDRRHATWRYGRHWARYYERGAGKRARALITGDEGVFSLPRELKLSTCVSHIYFVFS